jgi:DNA-3-methyladenine glycosylase II
MHSVNAVSVRKALLIDQSPVLLDISMRKKLLRVQVLRGEVNDQAVSFIRNYITEWFGPDKDIAAFYTLLRKHQSLAYMPEAFKGLRLIGIPDLFEALAWSIIGQQINLPFAYRVKRRFVEKYGSSILHDGTLYHIFPSCETVANASPEDLHQMQFSRRKAEYIVGLARAFISGRISKQQLTGLPDLISRQRALMNIRGIGIWTANYALMKSLKEPSCIPYGDAGLLKALMNHKIISEKKDDKQINEFFKKFPGWESYLVFYLWRSLAPAEKERILHTTIRQMG